MKPDRLHVTVSDGKYTLILREDGKAKALRYGEEWPAFENNRSPDNLHIALAFEVAALRERLGIHETLDDRSKLHAVAVNAVTALFDWWENEATKWTGWGEQIVPLHIELREEKVRHALSALRDSEMKFFSPSS